jgi:hypothetical protein
LPVIDTIREKIRDQEYEFTFPHFFEEMANDELMFAALSGQYPKVGSGDDSRATLAEHGTRSSVLQLTGGRSQSSAGSKARASFY